ncbi:MAG: hypothetical protein KF756_02735 [Acidobacteria bacterium]|nr:hypothetical protein [Acidobacteriota bacterium]
MQIAGRIFLDHGLDAEQVIHLLLFIAAAKKHLKSTIFRPAAATFQVFQKSNNNLVFVPFEVYTHTKGKDVR